MDNSETTLSERIESILDFDKRLFFLIVVLFYLIIRYITNDLILQSIPGYEKLEDDGSFMLFHIFNTLNYIWTPFALLWKFTLTAFIIWTGSFAFGYKAPFVKLWQYVLFAEIVFILPELIKMIYFIQPSDDVTFMEIRDFYPLSLFSLVDAEQVSQKYHYPLRAINLFEIVYIVLLVLGYHSISKRSLSESVIVILFSYVLFFLLWLLFYILVYK
ncbi:sulfate ABC transporter permease [Shivajiella indica]|uniref:Sulfate ABC transporter permease n=1 Tax=Shivajiella indica TaxID=872115 RepID=A0ABW5B8A9_9BACT